LGICLVDSKPELIWRMMDEPLVRVVNLFELLAKTESYLTQEQITDRVPGYPDGKVARNRAFERDKALLRRLGIELQQAVLPGRSNVGYRIDPKSLELELELSEEDLQILQSALSMVTFGSDSARFNASRLGLLFRRATPILIDAEPVEHIPDGIANAIRESRKIKVLHRGRPRILSPLQLLLFRGHSYLVAADEVGIVKTFRVDRLGDTIELLHVFDKSVFGSLPLTVPDAWQIGDDNPVEVSVFDREGLGPPEVREVRDVDSFLAEMILRSDEVGFTGPEWLLAKYRDRIVDAISNIERRWSIGSVRAKAKHRKESKAQSTGDRFVLVSSILSFIRHNGNRATIGEISNAVGADKESIASLLETIAMCGLPPYSPDMLFEVLVDRELDTVEVSIDTPLASLKKVNLLDALLLLEALDAIDRVQTVPGIGEVKEKLARAVGDPENVLGIVRRDSIPEDARPILEAINSSSCLSFFYRRSGVLRHAFPLVLFASHGNWYVMCATTGGSRRFRVDKMEEIKVVAFDGCVDEGQISGARSELERDPLGFYGGEWIKLEYDPRLEPLLDQLTSGYYESTDDGYLVSAVNCRWASLFLLALGNRAAGIAPQMVIEEALVRGRELARGPDTE
jgi:predicted DNA-binding transcriptional regulator YafY